jgi:hypothetical protein
MMEGGAKGQGEKQLARHQHSFGLSMGIPELFSNVCQQRIHKCIAVSLHQS